MNHEEIERTIEIFDQKLQDQINWLSREKTVFETTHRPRLSDFPSLRTLSDADEISLFRNKHQAVIRDISKLRESLEEFGDAYGRALRS